jgi:hypothetical protein
MQAMLKMKKLIVADLYAAIVWFSFTI